MMLKAFVWMIGLVLVTPSISLYAGLIPVAPDWKQVEARLQKAGFKKTFVSTLKKNYEPEHFHEVLELNLLLFLRKSDYHGPQVSDEAAGTVREFMKTNAKALAHAEKLYGVPPAVVASLLWLESRHGENLGRFHVPSVFVHLLQSERRPVIRHLQENATRFADPVPRQARKEINKRTKKKADWALGELKALQTMYMRDNSTLKNLRGSFSGAFGMSQFLPSSYVRWARAGKKGKAPQLENAEDAIHSVAYYLKDNGWRKLKKTHVKALLRYNNSQDYANAILKLSAQISAGGKRLPTSQDSGN
jgi:membrane-bound lytic murein transglycosylase B